MRIWKRIRITSFTLRLSIFTVAPLPQVLFDPSETSYENLLRIFFGRHDPTQADGQGNDKGTQYRAGVYFHDDDQVMGTAVSWRCFSWD